MLAAAVVVAGALGDDPVEFRKKELNPLIKRVSTEKASLAATLRVVRLGNKGDVAVIRRQIDRIAGTYDEIEKLDPPGEAREEFVRFVRANVLLVRRLREFATAFAAGKRGPLDAAGEAAQEAAGQSQRAEQELNRALASD